MVDIRGKDLMFIVFEGHKNDKGSHCRMNMK